MKKKMLVMNISNYSGYLMSAFYTQASITLKLMNIFLVVVILCGKTN